QNDEDVVNDRSKRGDHEASLGVLNGAEDAALVETELRRQHQAGEENDPGFFFGLKAGSNELSELTGKEFACEHESDEQDAHEGDYGGKDVPSLVFPVCGGIFGEDGNERDAEGRASDQIVEEIGKGEGGVIGVGHGIGADLVRYDP